MNIRDFHSENGILNRVVLIDDVLYQAQYQRIAPTTANPNGDTIRRLYDTDFHLVRDELVGIPAHHKISPYEKDVWVKGLMVSVYKGGADCTNNGISSKTDKLFLLDLDNSFGVPFHVDLLTDCLVLKFRTFSWGEDYVHAEPVIYPGRHKMFGGNLLYCSDSRFRDMTGIRYPITIHDRME